MCSLMLSIWIAVRFWRVDVVMDERLVVNVVFLEIVFGEVTVLLGKERLVVRA